MNPSATADSTSRLWLDRVARWCGVAALAIGVVVMAAWILNVAPLRLGIPGMEAPKFNGALGLVLLGGALLAGHVRGRSRRVEIAVTVVSGAVFVLGGVTTLEYLANADLGIDQLVVAERGGEAGEASHPGRMSPITAVSLMLCALGCAGLVRAHGRRQLLWIPALLAVVTVGLSAVSLSGYLSGVPTAYGWGSGTQQAVLAALALAVLGAGIFLASYCAATERDSAVPGWVPISFALGGFTAAIVASISLVEMRRQRIDEGVRISARAMASELEAIVATQVGMVERVARRLEREPRTFRERWEMEAEVFLDGSPACAALQLVGTDLKPLIIAPGVRGAATNRVVVPSGGAPVQAIETARTNRAVAVSRASVLPGGAWRVHVAAPVRLAATMEAFVLAEFRLAQLVGPVLQDKNRSVIAELHEGDVLLMQPEADAGDEPRQKHAIRKELVPKPGVWWMIEVWPAAAMRGRWWSSLPVVTLLGGSLLSALLGVTVQLLITTRAQHFEATANNARLERESQERRQAERELQAKRAQLQAILDNSPAVIYLKNLRGEYLLVNRQFEKLFHVSRELLVGKTDHDIFSKTLADRFRENDLAVAEGARVSELEEVAPHDDGLHTYVSVKFPMLDATGKPYGVCGISTDITERKRNEERVELSRRALEFANDRLTGIIEGTNDLVAALDLEGRFILFNRAYQREFQRRFGCVIQRGLRLRDALAGHPEDQDAANRAWTRALKGEVFTVVTEATGEGGEPRTFEVNYCSIRSAAGVLVGAAEFAHDITERRRAQRALEENEERLSLALESANAGTWHWDMLAQTIHWDERMHRLFGLAPGTFSGNYEAFAACLVREDRERVAGEVRDAIEKKIDFDSEYRVLLAGVEERWIAARGRVYRNAEGRPFRMVGVCWDVTRRKGEEQELKETTMALARSNADLQQFAYVASHDLQEPLRMVTSFLQLLSDRYSGRLDQEADDFINFAVDGAQRMHALINALLEYSRVGNKGRPFEEVDLVDIFALATANLRVAIAEAGAEVEHGPLPRVSRDSIQLVQLLQNLIANAVKFRRQGTTPKVRVDAEREHGHWKISVRDNGIGIDPKMHKRLFVIFQRLHNREEYPGTGIGLAVCKRIVERHAGHIWIESEPGRGSAFYFTLRAVGS